MINFEKKTEKKTDINKEIKTAKIFIIIFFILTFASFGILAFRSNSLEHMIMNFAFFVFCLAFYVGSACYLFYLRLLREIRKDKEKEVKRNDK
ncbi:MAG: hypothetical protein ACTSWZ_02815 [Candidatus Heimdallarchaeaceae archaeon]